MHQTPGDARRAAALQFITTFDGDYGTNTW